MAITTIYSKSGDTQRIPSGDLSYWKSQGWSDSKTGLSAPQEKGITDEQRVKEAFKQYGYTPTSADIKYWADPNKRNSLGSLTDNLVRRKRIEDSKTSGTDDRQRVTDAFQKYGYTPSEADIKYWTDSNKKNQYGSLEQNLDRRQKQEAPTEETAAKEFYRKGEDIYEAETDRRIGSTEWEKDWTGKAAEVNAPEGELEEEAIQEEEITDEIPTDWDLYQPFINNSPFLTEQFTDPKIKEQFEALPPELQMAYLQTMMALGDSIEAGKVVNPDIEITPEQAAEFLSQAKTELDPYYQEQINLYKDDLNLSTTRLMEDFEKGIRRAEDPFLKSLEAQSEEEAQAGLVYGSERARRQRESVQEQTNKIDDYITKSLRGTQDVFRQAERQLGSEAFAEVPAFKLPSVKATTRGFERGAKRSLFEPKGGLIGELPKSREVALSGRTSELEEAFRRQRILDLNK